MKVIDEEAEIFENPGNIETSETDEVNEDDKLSPMEQFRLSLPINPLEY